MADKQFHLVYTSSDRESVNRQEQDFRKCGYETSVEFDEDKLKVKLYVKCSERHADTISWVIALEEAARAAAKEVYGG